MTISTGTRNASLWERILPEIKQWLRDHPLASAVDAGKRFNLNHATLAARLKHDGDEFDFAARRTARGDLHRKPKRVKPTQGVDFRAEFDAILNALARLEGAVAAQSIVIQRDVTEDYARSRE
jgi:hypothetical protein